MSYRTEFIANCAARIDELRARLAANDFGIPSELAELAELIGATDTREDCLMAIKNNLRAIVRAESMTDEEFGESWAA